MKSIKIDKSIVIALYIIMLTGTMGIGISLSVQYRFFAQETQELIQMQQKYTQYVAMLKRSLDASLSDTENGQDEPDDTGVVKKEHELLGSDIQQPETIIDLDDNQSVFEQFKLISPEEERRLRSIKQALRTIKKSSVINKKRPVRRTKRLTSYRSGSFSGESIFSWPIDLSKFWLSSLYGWRRFSNRKISFHHGIDMASMRGTEVKAAAAGRVALAQWVSGYGNCIDIVHDQHYKTRYAHLQTIFARAGAQVKSGQCIGTVGDTGAVRKSGKDASHLHFEIHYHGQSVNPLKFLFV